MHITIIGMSGLGKSYWSAKMASEGFKRFCCDDMITEKLADDLKNPDGTEMDLGDWMGFPYTPGYREKADLYLAHENSVVAEIIAYLEKSSERPDETVVVDTTGSFIYTDPGLITTLSALTTVAHLAVSLDVYKKMLQKYTANPRPVIWGDRFTVRPGETDGEALARCYHDLLLYREQRYRECAHISVDYDLHADRGMSVGDFLDLIRAS